MMNSISVKALSNIKVMLQRRINMQSDKMIVIAMIIVGIVLLGSIVIYLIN